LSAQITMASLRSMWNVSPAGSVIRANDAPPRAHVSSAAVAGPEIPRSSGAAVQGVRLDPAATGRQDRRPCGADSPL
jgi:hypothetical protein